MSFGHTAKPLPMQTRVRLVKMCAQAMAYHVTDIEAPSRLFRGLHGCDCREIVHVNELPDFGQYCPLHDDGAMMALVKAYKMRLGYEGDGAFADVVTRTDRLSSYNRLGDLNRAVVQAVALMMISREKT